jgi:hypothetical protein
MVKLVTNDRVIFTPLELKDKEVPIYPEDCGIVTSVNKYGLVFVRFNGASISTPCNPALLKKDDFI